jgi:hypothetical protein
LQLKTKTGAFEIIINEYENDLFEYGRFLRDIVDLGLALDPKRKEIMIEVKDRIRIMKPIIHKIIKRFNEERLLTNKQIELVYRIKGLEFEINSKIKKHKQNKMQSVI